MLSSDWSVVGGVTDTVTLAGAPEMVAVMPEIAFKLRSVRLKEPETGLATFSVIWDRPGVTTMSCKAVISTGAARTLSLVVVSGRTFVELTWMIR